MEAYTPRTICSSEQLRSELAAIARRGYAINNGELLAGYFVIAAPVRGRDKRTMAAISITLPTELMAGGKEAEFAPMVVEAAEKTSLQLGFASWPVWDAARRDTAERVFGQAGDNGLVE